MGKVTVWIAAGLSVIAIATGTYFLFIRDTSSEKGDETSNEENTTYYIESDVPPSVSEYLDNTFKELGYIDDTSNPLIRVTYNDDESTSEDINLYQIWVMAKPFRTYNQSRGNTISSVSEFIDSKDPLELVEESDSTLVSLETEYNDDGLKLLTLEELTPDLIPVEESGIDTFSPSTWDQGNPPIISHVSISGDETSLDEIRTTISNDSFLEEYNYRTELPEDDDFVTIFKTGTTVTGGPGWELCENKKGRLDYPILEVKERLSTADIAIISNETSFVNGCSQEAGTTSFCGKPSYLQNILDMGIDIVSLTGNHMADYGRDAFSDMLETYKSNGISYFGSGENSSDAWNPLLIETNAGTIAFIGYNNMGPAGVLSTDTQVGAASYDRQLLEQALASASTKSDLIWVDTHLWPEYGTVPDKDQILLSREAIDLGADIVTGVSSHEIQGMTFYDSKPIFYGLGNFLFDQMWSTETRQGMALEVTVFEGNIVNVELNPTLMYDYCQPRFLSDSAKDSLIDYFISISDL